MMFLSAIYKQLKISVDLVLAEAFKSACLEANVSMASEISGFMAVRTGSLTEMSVKKAKQAIHDTRRKRRQQVGSIILSLESIRNTEDSYRSNIPDNLQSGPAFENAEMAVEILDQAIELLREAY